MARRLLGVEAPVLLVANKVDDTAHEAERGTSCASDSASPIPSRLHGRNTGDLLDALIEVLPTNGR